jgi:hypothetical protein
MPFARRFLATVPPARRGAISAVVLGLALAMTPHTAHAQSPDEIKIARQTAQEGLAAYKAKEFQKALEAFEQARALYPSAQILRMTGYSYLALEHWEKAVEAMEAALDSKVGPLSENDRKDVHDQLALALAHYGTINVTSKVDGAKLSVDGGDPKPLPLEKPLRLLEGHHTFAVRAEGRDDASKELDVAGGKTVDLPLDPEEKVAKKPPPPPPPPPPPKPAPPPEPKSSPTLRTLGFVGIGAGVVAGGAAIIAAAAGAKLRSNVAADIDLHHQNFGQSCDKGDFRLCAFDRDVINHDADRANGLRNASIGLAIGAAVVGGGGLALVLLNPNKSAPPTTGGALPTAAPRPAAGPSLACSMGGPGLFCSGAF